MNTKFEVERFRELKGLDLARYVDAIEHSGLSSLRSETISDLLTDEANLTLDHIIYLTRWGAKKNLSSISDVILRVMEQNTASPGLHVTLMRTLLILPGVSQKVYDRLSEMQTRVPDSAWKEYLNKVRVL